nr:hypothetical protein [Tanacetum cinerariifolium]
MEAQDHQDPLEDRRENFNEMSIEINKKKKLQQLEQAANLSAYSPEPSRHFNSFCYDDDYYEESAIPLNEIVSLVASSIAITPVLPTEEPEDSRIMRDEDLNTNPEKESDEVILARFGLNVYLARFDVGLVWLDLG